MPDENSLTAVCVYPALILTRINKRTRHWMEELAGIKDLGRKIRMEWKKKNQEEFTRTCSTGSGD